VYWDNIDCVGGGGGGGGINTCDNFIDRLMIYITIDVQTTFKVIIMFHGHCMVSD
jgi:hypothetical protein